MSQRHAFHIVSENFSHPEFNQISDIYTRTGFTAECPSILRRNPLRTTGSRLKKQKSKTVFPSIWVSQPFVET